jgi:phosphate transport system protein
MTAEMIEKKDESLIQAIKDHDYKINTLDSLIEKKVTAILALRQPMAVDLRYIVSSLKVSSNLERSGDKAKSIIKKISRIGKEGFDDTIEKALYSMIELCKKMVRNSVTAYDEQNTRLAESVLEEDDQMDQIYGEFFDMIGNETFNKEQVKRIMNTLFIAKSFERIADHSTNIAEITNFVVTGESK